MSERLADIQSRSGAARQFSMVAAALRAAAGARASEARVHLEPLRTYSDIVARSLAMALRIQGRQDLAMHAQTQDRILIVLGAEQGFAGGYGTRVLHAAKPLLAQAKTQVIMAGLRSCMAARESGWPLAGDMPMPVRADDVASAADRLLNLLEQTMLTWPDAEIYLFHMRPASSAPAETSLRRLLPLDLSALDLRIDAHPPIMANAPHDMIPALIQDYVFALLCDALNAALVAENEARMRAMTETQKHVGDLLEELTTKARRIRQDEITNDVIDLAARLPDSRMT